MRQLLVQVPQGYGQQVLQIAQECDGTQLAQLQASGMNDPLDVVIVHLPNRQVETFLDELEKLPDVQIAMFPTGALTLKPPPEEAPQQIKNVQTRSPIEVFLSGLQSVGSWKGFLGYAALAGVVVWIGLYTNTSYLLVAAMLIAPFAGPAMNLAIATARGDRQLIGRTLLRYFAALGVSIAVAGILSLVLRQEIATAQMVATSELSSISVLLPLAAGAAGALHLVQAERSSLVSGAAVGLLVAASLAPPAGLVGMATVIGRWDMAKSGLFLLLLQLAGINLTAALLFRAFGVSSRGPRYNRGRRWATLATLMITVLGLAGLLSWQLTTSPNLQRSSRAQQAAAEIQRVVNQSNLAELVETNVRFTRTQIEGQNTLLGMVYVQPRAGVTASAAQIRQSLTQAIQTRLLAEGFNATPLIDVSVLEPPSQPQP